jgi:hypothetical protein
MDIFKAGPDSDPCQNPALEHTAAQENILVPVTVIKVKDEVMVS